MLQRLAGPAGLALANVRLTLELRRRLAQETALAEQVWQSRQRLLDAADDGRVAVRRRRRGARASARSAAPNRALSTRSRRCDAPAQVVARAGPAQQALDTLRDVAGGRLPAALTERGARRRWRPTRRTLAAHRSRRRGCRATPRPSRLLPTSAPSRCLTRSPAAHDGPPRCGTTWCRSEPRDRAVPGGDVPAGQGPGRGDGRHAGHGRTAGAGSPGSMPLEEPAVADPREQVPR